MQKLLQKADGHLVKMLVVPSSEYIMSWKRKNWKKILPWKRQLIHPVLLSRIMYSLLNIWIYECSCIEDFVSFLINNFTHMHVYYIRKQQTYVNLKWIETKTTLKSFIYISNIFIDLPDETITLKLNPLILNVSIQFCHISKALLEFVLHLWNKYRDGLFFQGAVRNNYWKWLWHIFVKMEVLYKC